MSTPQTDPIRIKVMNGMLEVIDTQMKKLDPPEARSTYERLVAKGYSDEEIRTLMAKALISELFLVTKHGAPFNRKRYAEMLRDLPRMPTE
ncbi:MAG: hypothetical protein H7831_04730 [Magnetococcus sp. WYHC-3]